MLKRYPVGSDISLVNAFYLYPKKQSDGKWDKGSITIVYKDNRTGEKFQESIEDPMYEFYKAKDECVIEHNELFELKSNVEKMVVPYRNLVKEIASITDNMEYFNENIRNGNRRANNKLHTHPRIFSSDMNIEDRYRMMFDRLYTNDSIPVTKVYFDIEVDGKDQKGDFPEPGECPINATSLINDIDKRIYVFLLRNKENPLIEEFENYVNEPHFKSDLKEFICNAVGGWKNEKRYGLDEYDYKVMFYDEEIDLIKDVFTVINYFKPDFVLAWNMAFDIPYIIQRIINLGYDPAEIMCHPDFKFKVCRYFIDEQKDTIAERCDFATISSYSVFLDQMIQFGSRRKGQSQFHSLALDFIGMAVANVKKLDYSHITTHIVELPYKNYKVFAFYNIMDTIVQKCVEMKTGDIDYVYAKCLVNNTRYSKCHRQTTYLTNRLAKEFYEDGYIIGNNPNVFKPKTSEKFDGAYVASPKRINDYSKFRLDGQPISVYDNCNDFDYSAQYPNEARENNIAAFTQIGMVKIEEIIYANENPFKKEKYNRGGAFIEDFVSHNYIEFCTRWLRLAGYAQLCNDIMEFFTKVKMPVFDPAPFTPDGQILAMKRIDENIRYKTAMTRSSNDKMISLIRYHERPDFKSLVEQINVDEVVYNEYRTVG